MPSGQSALSAPPATITSASSMTIIRAASPIEWAPAEQAVTTAWGGPRAPPAPAAACVHDDRPGRLADRMGAGRAGRHHGMVRAHQPVFDRDLAGDQVDEAAVDEVRADPPRPLLVEDERFLLDAGKAANARSDRHAGAEAVFLAHVGETRILEGLAGRGGAVGGERGGRARERGGGGGSA